MPRRYRRKRRPRRRRRRYVARKPRRHPGSYLSFIPASINAIGQNLANLKNFINVEWKSTQVDYAATSIPSGSNRSLLNGLSLGDDHDNRHGRSVHFKSVHLKLDLTANVANTIQSVRLLLVVDKTPGGASFATTDLLDASTITAHRNLSFRRRLVVLWDKTFHIYTGSTSHRRRIEYYRQINVKTTYDDSDNGDITDIQANSIVLVQISDQGANFPSMTGSARLRYIDN